MCATGKLGGEGIRVALIVLPATYILTAVAALTTWLLLDGPPSTVIPASAAAGVATLMFCRHAGPRLVILWARRKRSGGRASLV